MVVPLAPVGQDNYSRCVSLCQGDMQENFFSAFTAKGGVLCFGWGALFRWSVGGGLCPFFALCDIGGAVVMVSAVVSVVHTVEVASSPTYSPFLNPKSLANP